MRGEFCQHAYISNRLSAIGHDLGRLIALRLALDYPTLIEEMVLPGPPPSPLLVDEAKELYDRAMIARARGMVAVSETSACMSTNCAPGI